MKTMKLVAALLFVGIFTVGCEAAVARPVTQPNLSAACTGDSECSSGLFCRKYDGECSAQGACAPLDNGPCVPAPVCGCDGHTYASVCEAYSAGVNVASLGACP